MNKYWEFEKKNTIPIQKSYWYIKADFSASWSFSNSSHSRVPVVVKENEMKNKKDMMSFSIIQNKNFYNKKLKLKM